MNLSQNQEDFRYFLPAHLRCGYNFDNSRLESVNNYKVSSEYLFTKPRILRNVKMNLKMPQTLS